MEGREEAGFSYALHIISSVSTSHFEVSGQWIRT